MIVRVTFPYHGIGLILTAPLSDANGTAMQSAVCRASIPSEKMVDVQALHPNHFLLRSMAIDMDVTENFKEQLKKLGLGEPREFQPSIEIIPEVKRLRIIMESVPCYNEWIKGEDGDISISRANDDGRVVAAFLPLRVWNGKFPVDIINLSSS
jgi:hypothetical protein